MQKIQDNDSRTQISCPTYNNEWLNSLKKSLNMLTIGDGSQSFQWPVHYVTANEEHSYFKIELIWIFANQRKWLTGFLILLRKKIVECVMRAIRTIVEPVAKCMRLVIMSELILAKQNIENNLGDWGNVIRNTGILGRIAFRVCPPAIRIGGGVVQPTKVPSSGTLIFERLVDRPNHQQWPDPNLWRNIRDFSSDRFPLGQSVAVVWKNSGWLPNLRKWAEGSCYWGIRVRSANCVGVWTTEERVSNRINIKLKIAKAKVARPRQDGFRLVPKVVLDMQNKTLREKSDLTFSASGGIALHLCVSARESQNA